MTVEPRSFNTLQIVRLSGRIGAEIRNLDLTGTLDAPTIADLRAALIAHKVIFIRGQTHLDDTGQEAFAMQLGALYSHPTIPVVGGTKHTLGIYSDFGVTTNSWHTDLTFVPNYPAVSVLRGVVIPAFGGDTVWANTASAYEHLPKSLRVLADELWAVHSNEYDYAAARHDISYEEERLRASIFASTVLETEHPVVRVHPESGERTLVLGHFFKKFVGLSSVDSARLFSIFQEHITKAENTVRWRWQEGDIAIWDNRSTQHAGVADFLPERRVLHRVTIAGDVPVAIDGRESRVRRGLVNLAA